MILNYTGICMDLHFTFILMPDELIMIHLTIMNAKGISNDHDITTVPWACLCNFSLSYFLQKQRIGYYHWQRVIVLLLPSWLRFNFYETFMGFLWTYCLEVFANSHLSRIQNGRKITHGPFSFVDFAVFPLSPSGLLVSGLHKLSQHKSMFLLSHLRS